MKFIFIIFLVSICNFSVFSQFKIIAQSEPFEEPANNYGKLLQLTNGNTLLLLTTKTEITGKIFDTHHRLTANRQINKPGSEIQGIEEVFELNGNLVFFYKTIEHDQDD